MKKISLKIDISDNEYSDRLTEYIKINGLNMFEITDKNTGIMLKDMGDELEISCNDMTKSTSKFQNADNIINSISEVALNCGFTGFSSAHSKNRIIAVTSAHGGAGKSFVSQALSIFLARNGSNVLYINMDTLCTGDSVFFSDGQKDISIFMHHIKKRSENIGAYLHMYKNRDGRFNVYYLLSMYPSVDIEMDDKQTEFFIDCLNKDAVFDYTIIDIPLYCDKNRINMLSLCSKTLFIKNSGSDREENAFDFLKKNNVSPIPVCNAVRYTQGVYIPKTDFGPAGRSAELYDAFERIMYETEKNDEY